VKALEIEQINLSTITDEEVKNQIKRMYLLDGLLYVNDLIVEQQEGKYSFEIKDIAYELMKEDDHYLLSYSYINVLKNHLWIELTTLNGIHTLLIYPDIDSNKCVKLQGQIIDNYVYFDNYSDYSFLIDLDNNILKVNDEIISIEKGQENQRVFFEAFVTIPYISPQYLNQLESKNYFDATDTLYENSKIKKLATNEKLILYNSKSNYEYNTTLMEYVYVWPRIGKEDYIIDYTKVVKEVFQYQQAIDAGLDVGERKYAILANNLIYQGVDVVQIEGVITKKKYSEPSDWLTYADYMKKISSLSNYETETKEMYKVLDVHYPEEYKISNTEVKSSNTKEVIKESRSRNVSYSSWTDYAYTKAQLENLSSFNQWEVDGKEFYSKSIATWSDYSDYVTEDKTATCTTENNCRYKTRTKYAKKSGSWATYSAYKYKTTDLQVTWCQSSDNCDYDTKTMYAKAMAYITGKYSDYVSSCLTTGTYRCEKYYKYTCSSGLMSNTKYSTVSYNIGSQGVCLAGYTITNKESGYRKQFIEYEEVSDDDYLYDSCFDITGTQKCFAQERVALRYREYSAPTDYIYDVCLDNSDEKDQEVVTMCLAKKEFAYSNRSWSNYSDYIYEQKSEEENVKWRQMTKYAVRMVTYSEWTDWGKDDGKENENIQKQYRWLYKDAIIDGYHFYDTYQPNSVKEKAYRYKTYVLENKIGLVDAYTLKTKTLEDISEITTEEIFSLNDEIDKEINIADEIIKNEAPILVSEVDNITITQTNWLLNQTVFVPYIYVKPHWRAAPATISVQTLKGMYQEYSEEKEFVNKTEIVSSNMKEYQENEGRVIFFDKDDPLGNYENLPDNWNKELIDNIKTINEAEYHIVLKKTDILRLKEWIKDNVDKIGDGSLLKEINNGYTD